MLQLMETWGGILPLIYLACPVTGLPLVSWMAVSQWKSEGEILRQARGRLGDLSFHASDNEGHTPQGPRAAKQWWKGLFLPPSSFKTSAVNLVSTLYSGPMETLFRLSYAFWCSKFRENWSGEGSRQSNEHKFVRDREGGWKVANTS